MTEWEFNFDAFARQLIDANHILHHQGLLDAYGHVSAREPVPLYGGLRFLLSRDMAPATISAVRDIKVYDIRNGEPEIPYSVDPVKHFIERYIHSEIYRRFPMVKAIAHCHSDAVVPFTVSGVPLRACSHLAGFLGASDEGVPVFDQGEFAPLGKLHDMLVTDTKLGEEFTKHFDSGHSVVLQRSHGFTVIGNSIEDMVVKAVYTHKNAAIQASAIATQAAFLACGGTLAPAEMFGEGWRGLRYLSVKETKDAEYAQSYRMERPWLLWVAEVRASGLYKIDSGDGNGNGDGDGDGDGDEHESERVVSDKSEAGFADGTQNALDAIASAYADAEAAYVEAQAEAEAERAQNEAEVAQWKAQTEAEAAHQEVQARVQIALAATQAVTSAVEAAAAAVAEAEEADD